MNTLRFTQFVFILAIIALITGLAACDQIGQLLSPAPPQMESPSGEISIGLVYPISGRLASVGMEMRNGFELALEEINNSQLSNATLKFVTVDSQGTAEGAIAAFNKLIHQDGVSIILGPGTSKCNRSSVPNRTTEWSCGDKCYRCCPWFGRDWRFLCFAPFSPQMC